MYGFSYLRDFTVVSNGRCNGRSSHQNLRHGRVTITGRDRNDQPISRVVQVVDGEIVDNRLRVNGKLVHHIAYGQFESTLSDAGRNVVRFRKGTGTGRHGKSRRYEDLFGHPGCCHSWYKNGRLVRQKFLYANGVTAYDWRPSAKPREIRAPNGELLYRVSGTIDSRRQWPGDSVFNRPMEEWFLHSRPFMVEAGGKTIFAGQYAHRQRVGRWVLDGQEHYYEHGVAIPKKLFETTPEKLDPWKLLRIPNAQLRMAMLAKADFSAQRLSQVGRVVHKDKAMRLFDVPGLETRILQVQCNSTKSFYFIHVPKDSRKCEEARQWTFHVRAGVSQPIHFNQET